MIKPRLKIIHLMGSIVIACLLLLMLRRTYYYFQHSKDSLSYEQSCQSNLNNIASALINYCENYGHFPPTFLTDKSGKRWQSWRASILPWFPFDQDLTAMYKPDDAWDSTINRRLCSTTPSYYRCPLYNHIYGYNSTTYTMISDLSSFSMSEAPKRAILIVEIGASDHYWASPFDDSSDWMNFAIKSNKHPHGFGVILSDFTRHRLVGSDKIRKTGKFYVLDD